MGTSTVADIRGIIRGQKSVASSSVNKPERICRKISLRQKSHLRWNRRGGKAHDKKQLDEENLGEYIPNDVAIEGDLGFKGLEQEYENVYLPHKKPKGKELSALQKIQNRELSRERVKCEQAQAGIKRYNCVTAVYRNRVPDFDDRLRLNSTGLWNFYLDAA